MTLIFVGPGDAARPPGAPMPSSCDRDYLSKWHKHILTTRTRSLCFCMLPHWCW